MIYGSARAVIAVDRNCFRCGSEFRDYAGTQRLCTSCKKPPRDPRWPTTLRDQPLSAREAQVVARVVEGKLNKEIAYELHLTEGTIKEYMHRIFRKTGVTNRALLAVWWVRKQLAEPPVTT